VGHKGGLLAVVASVALTIAGCGDGDDAELASMAPPDAPFYAEFTMRPEGDQADAIEAFADRVAGLGDPGAALIAELDASLADDGVDATYDGEIEPWLGDRGAIFVRSFGSAGAGMDPDAAVLIDVTDAGAAEEFIDRVIAAEPEPTMTERSYGGFDYMLDEGEGTAVGLIDEVLAFGPEDSFKVAVDAADGESLAESEEYRRRTDALGDELLASAYLEPAAAIEAGLASEDLGPEAARAVRPLLGGLLSNPLAIGLSATTEAAHLDFVCTVDGQEDIATSGSLLEELPAASWLAFGAPDLGSAFERTLDQLANGGLPGGASVFGEIRDATGIDLHADSLDWLADTSAFVEGTAPGAFTAGLIAEVADPEGPRPLLARVQALAERDSGLRSAAPPEGADYGFSLGLPGLGGGAEAGVVGDRMVAVVGGTIAQALDPEARLGDDPGYQAAIESLGEEFPPGLYVDLPSLLDVAEQGGSADDPDFQTARPYLEAFASLAAGGHVEDELAVTRLSVSLAE
jgi:hypothetical protein